MNNWQTKKLENCLEKIPSLGSILSSEYLDGGEFPVIDQGQNFIAGYTNDESLVFQDCLPVVIFGDHTRVFKYIDFPFAVGADGTKILKPTNDFDPSFFYYMLLSLDLGSRGYARHFKLLKELQIPLPTLPEQKRIVKILDEKMEKIREAKQLREESIKDTDKILSRTLHEIFEEGKKKGWEEKEIKDVCENPQYGFTASAKLEKVGPRMLRITDIQDGKVNWSTVPYCKCDEPKKYQLKNGDIVFARTGATVGKSFLITNIKETAVFASYLIRITPKQDLTPEFLYYFFQSSDYWNQITEQAVGGAQPNVNGTKLAKLKISVPPLAEQKQIVKKLDTLSEKLRALCDLQAGQLDDLKKLEKAYLREAFNGEL
ncbi:MAG: restriction endonuclease subunit S [Candidatus Paceibacterota bacterium]|jgi:type I restriction enzyme S subunit